MAQLKVSGVTGGHCVPAATRAVQSVPGATDAAASLERGEVNVGG